jgi:hypothetical protein
MNTSSMNLAYSASSIASINSLSLSSSVVSTDDAADRRLLHPSLVEESPCPSST